MGIGLGIVLLLAGLILVTDVVNFDVCYVNDNGLGWILLVVGVLAIVLALVLNQQRGHTSPTRRAPHRGVCLPRRRCGGQPRGVPPA